MKKLFFVFAIISIPLLLSGCFNKGNEQVSNIVKENKQLSDYSNVNVYEADASESSIRWESGKIIGGPFYGFISLKEGRIALNDGEPVFAEFVIDMNSIDNRNLEGDPKKNLEDHLKSEDFFNVSQFSEASLIINDFEKKFENNYMATGNLTIKGNTREISFTIVLNVNEDEVNAAADISIDRTLWDIKYGSGSFFDDLGDDTIKDTINFNINILSKN